MNILILNGEDIGDPEVMAMLQAMYSRSPMSINDRLADLRDPNGKLSQEALKKKMKTYYVGYGHASIADCGDAVVFVEGVSMLAAKVIQDDPLYNGQECSTRYLDFSTQPFLTANNSIQEVAIVERWRDLYTQYLPWLRDWALKTYDLSVVSARIPEENQEETRVKTCNAIAFDVARALLPCGASTYVAWKTSLRRFGDRCAEMMLHPLAEVREIGKAVYYAQKDKHPSSFADYVPSDLSLDVQHFYNNEPRVYTEGPSIQSVWNPQHETEQALKDTIKDSLEHADSRTALPRELFRRSADNILYFAIEGMIDFGSFRDLQRHRNGLNKLPIVGQYKAEFNSYYARILRQNLDLWPKVCHLMTDIGNMSGISDIEAQYLYPMGVNVHMQNHWSLGQMRYVMGLRSKTSVHPTARNWIHSLQDELKIKCSLAVPYCPVDRRPHYQASDRGEQTIKERS